MLTAAESRDQLGLDFQFLKGFKNVNLPVVDTMATSAARAAFQTSSSILPRVRTLNSHFDYS